MRKAEIEAKTNGENQRVPLRAEPRFVPLETLSVVLFEDHSLLARGIVSNISERGARLITNAMIEPGRQIRVKFTTRRRTELFQADARVVWSDEGMDPNLEIVGVMVGVAFLDQSESQREKIAEILMKGSFHEVAPTDEPMKSDVPWPTADSRVATESST